MNSYKISAFLLCILAASAYMLYNGSAIVVSSKKTHKLPLHKNAYLNTTSSVYITSFVYTLENDEKCIYLDAHQVEILSKCDISFSTKNPNYKQLCIPFDDIMCEPDLFISGVMYIVAGVCISILISCALLIHIHETIKKRKNKHIEIKGYTEMV